MSLKYQNTNVIKELHGKPIYCVTFNTYDPANQDLVASVGGHQATVYRCHPLGRVEVLQVYVDDHMRKLNDDVPEHEDFYVCKWSVDAATGDPLLLLAGKLALIRVVNCHKKQAVRTLKGHGKDVNDIAVHPQHPHIVISASKDHSIRLWNIQQACCVLLMRGPGAHVGEVFTLDFHPWDPYLFVSGAMEGAVKIWSLKEHWMGIEASQEWDEEPQQRAFPVRLVGYPVFSSRQVHNDYVDCCRWLGDLVLSKSVDYKIKLWRPHYPTNPILETSSKFTLLRVFDFSGDVMWWLRFSLDPYGQVLACGNTNGKTFIWSPGQGKAARAIELRNKNCTAVIRQTAVSMDGSIIICSTEDAHLWRWDLQPAAAGADRQQQQQQAGSKKGSKAAAGMSSAAAGGSSAKWLGAASTAAAGAAADGSASDADDVEMADAAETQAATAAVGIAGVAKDAGAAVGKQAPRRASSSSPPLQQQQQQQQQRQQQPKKARTASALDGSGRAIQPAAGAAGSSRAADIAAAVRGSTGEPPKPAAAAGAGDSRKAAYRPAAKGAADVAAASAGDSSRARASHGPGAAARAGAVKQPARHSSLASGDARPQVDRQPAASGGAATGDTKVQRSPLQKQRQKPKRQQQQQQQLPEPQQQPEVITLDSD